MPQVVMFTRTPFAEATNTSPSSSPLASMSSSSTVSACYDRIHPLEAAKQQDSGPASSDGLLSGHRFSGFLQECDGVDVDNDNDDDDYGHFEESEEEEEAKETVDAEGAEVTSAELTQTHLRTGLMRARDEVSNVQSRSPRQPNQRLLHRSLNERTATGTYDSNGTSFPSRCSMVDIKKGIASFLSLHDELERNNRNESASAMNSYLDESSNNVLPGRRGSGTCGVSFEDMREASRLASIASREAQRRAERAQRVGGAEGRGQMAALKNVKTLKAIQRVSSLPLFGGEGGLNYLRQRKESSVSGDQTISNHGISRIIMEEECNGEGRWDSIPKRRNGAKGNNAPLATSGEHRQPTAGGRGAAFAMCGCAAVNSSSFSASTATIPLVAKHGCVAHIQICRHPSPASSQPNDDEDEQSEHLSFSTATNAEEDHRRLRLATELPSLVRSLLSDVYGRIPNRSDPSQYVVLEGGAGVGMTLCVFEPAPGFPDVERTALWFASRLLAWARAGGESEGEEEIMEMNRDPSWGTRGRRYDLRCGLSAGVMEIVRDTYGFPGVIGSCADSAAKIAECAHPGQILANSETVIPIFLDIASPRINVVTGVAGDVTLVIDKLKLDYRVDPELHDVLIHDEPITLVAQSVTGTVASECLSSSYSSLEGISIGPTVSAVVPYSVLPFGTDIHPEKKWEHRLKPTELPYNSCLSFKAKSSPKIENLIRHRRVAFVGITNCDLTGIFRQVLEADPSLNWDRMYIFFLSNNRLSWIADNCGNDTKKTKTEQALRMEKVCAKAELEGLLKGRVADLRFLEYDRPYYCASYWDWDERGGLIHVSPLVWGSDLATCPAINYQWITTDAEDDYVAYQDGLTSLLQTSKVI